MSAAPGDPTNSGRGRKQVELIPASMVPCQPIDWLWEGWLARSKLHILAGAPSDGKTTLALVIAALVTTGGILPTGERAQVGNVLIWSGEDGAADTLVPRLRAAGADLDRVFFVGQTTTGQRVRSFDPAEDLAALEECANDIGGVSLIIVDPIVSVVNVDSHKNTEVRRALQPLVDLGARLNAAVLGVSHFSKGTAGRDPTERVVGSIAFGAVARIVMVTARNWMDPTTGQSSRLLVRAKSNLGLDEGGLSFEIEPVSVGAIQTTRVAWGRRVEGPARDLLGMVKEGGLSASAYEQARTWLTERLAAGPVATTRLRVEAEAAGTSWRTVERVKPGLQIRATKRGDHWEWALPNEDRQDRQP